MKMREVVIFEKLLCVSLRKKNGGEAEKSEKSGFLADVREKGGFVREIR